MVPIERTTLRGVKVFAAIAGKDKVHKDTTEPTGQRDAIWHFFYKARGKSPQPKFRAEELKLAVVIDYEEYERIKQMKEDLDLEHDNTPSPTKVSKYNPTSLCIAYRIFNRLRVDAENARQLDASHLMRMR